MSRVHVVLLTPPGPRPPARQAGDTDQARGILKHAGVGAKEEQKKGCVY